MGDFTELLIFLTDAGGAVIPWLFLALVVWLALYVVPKLLPDVKDYFKAKGDAHKLMADREAERNEIMRNNNAVIENNTAMLEIMRGYTDKQCETIRQHESMSAERMANIQSVLDSNHDELSKLRGEIGILLDRTN